MLPAVHPLQHLPCRLPWRGAEDIVVGAFDDFVIAQGRTIPPQPPPGELAMNGLVISLPTSFRPPARLREPLTRFSARLPEVRAAWLFFEENPAQPYEEVYVVGCVCGGRNRGGGAGGDRLGHRQGLSPGMECARHPNEPAEPRLQRHHALPAILPVAGVSTTQAPVTTTDSTWINK